MSEHGGMSFAAHDILSIESFVIGNGLSEALNSSSDTLFESSTPQLGLFCRCHFAEQQRLACGVASVEERERDPLLMIGEEIIW